MTNFLKDFAFYGESGSIYCHSYDGSLAPSEAVDVLFKGAKSVSDYSDVIPLALAVYLVGGSDALENLMMSLLKEAVLGMAQNAGDIKKNKRFY